MSSDLPRHRTRAVAALVLAATIVAGACSGDAGSPSPSPSPTLADPTTGPPELQVALPAGWQEIELTEAALQAQIDVMAETNPELVAPLQQLLSSGLFESLAFYAIGYDGAEPIGNANAVTFPMALAGIDALAPLVEGQLQQIGAADIVVGRRTVLGTDGLVVDYHLEAPVNGATPTFTARAFVALIGGTVYDVTITCTATDPAACLADSDEIGAGMTLGAP